MTLSLVFAINDLRPAMFGEIIHGRLAESVTLDDIQKEIALGLPLHLLPVNNRLSEISLNSVTPSN